MSRWLTILDELQASRLGVPAETLARRHGWNPRTVYRDLRGLEAAGFPLTSVDGRWRLVEGWRRNLPFPLSRGERIALAFARALLAPIAATRVGCDFDRLHQRLIGTDAPYRPRQGELFARLRPALTTASPIAIDYGAHAAVLEALCQGCESQRTLRAVYYAETRAELTRRDLDPYHVHWDPRLEALYVFAWCHLRRAVRTFAVHRFRQVTLTPQHFTMPAEFSPERHLRTAFRIWRAANAVTVRLAIAPGAAGWIAERRWHASQTLRRRSDGGCELALTVDPTIELKRFLLGLGSAVEVLEPISLRDELAAEHLAAAQMGRRRTRRKTLTSDVSAVRQDRAPGHRPR